MMEIYGTVLILIKVKVGEEILPYIIFLLILISMVFMQVIFMGDIKNIIQILWMNLSFLS